MATTCRSTMRGFLTGPRRRRQRSQAKFDRWKIVTFTYFARRIIEKRPSLSRKKLKISQLINCMTLKNIDFPIGFSGPLPGICLIGRSFAASVGSAEPSPRSRDECRRAHSEGAAGDQARLVAGKTGAAYIRTDVIDETGRVRADTTGQSGTALALAAHSLLVRRDEARRQQIEVGVAFGGKPWPVR